MTESEIWKDVAGYEGFYQVSNKGNVRSVARKDSIGRKCGGRMLKLGYDGKGYRQLSLYKNGKAKTKSVHRIVAEAFIPNPKGFLEINHKDENKSNNEFTNLEWCIHKYNVNYGTRNERMAQAQSKKVRAVNAKTGEVVTFKSTREAERKGYRSSNVSMACRGVYKDNTGKLIGDGHLYRGHKWSYEEVEGNESK